MAENLNVSLTVHGVPGISTDLTSAEQLSIVKEKEVAPAPTAQAQPIPTTTNLAYSGNVSATHLSNTSPTYLSRNLNFQTNPQLTQMPIPSNFPKISTIFDKAPAFQNKNTAMTKHHHTNTPTLALKETTQHTKHHSETINALAANTHPNILDSFHIPKHTHSFQPSANVHQSTQFYDSKSAATLNQTEDTAQPYKPTNYPVPSPPTITQSHATKLRARQAAEIAPIEFTPPKITTKQGQPTVIFTKKDYMITLASRCQYTIVGKVLNTMPRMELIRRCFIAQIKLKGGVKIDHFNARTVYIDLDNEYDNTTV